MAHYKLLHLQDYERFTLSLSLFSLCFGFESKSLRTEVAVELRLKLIIAIVVLLAFMHILVEQKTAKQSQSTINQFYDIILIFDMK